MQTDRLERIISGAIALLLVSGSLVATVVAAAHGGQAPALPEWLVGATTMVTGYYFGAHLNQGSSSAQQGGDSGANAQDTSTNRTGQDKGV